MDRHIDENTLTGEVTNRPAIWDSLSDEYNDSVKRRMAWDEVVEVFSQPGDSLIVKMVLGKRLRLEWTKIRHKLMKKLRWQLLSDIDMLYRLSNFRGDAIRNSLTAKSLQYFIDSISQDYEQSLTPDERSIVNLSGTPQGPSITNDNIAGNSDEPLVLPRGNRNFLNINEIIDMAIEEEEQAQGIARQDGQEGLLDSYDSDEIRSSVRQFLMAHRNSPRILDNHEDSIETGQLSPNTMLQQLRDRYDQLKEQLRRQKAPQRSVINRQVWNYIRQPHFSGYPVGMEPQPVPMYVRRVQPFYPRPNNLITIPPGIPRVAPLPTFNELTMSSLDANMARDFNGVAVPTPSHANTANGQFVN